MFLWPALVTKMRTHDGGKSNRRWYRWVTRLASCSFAGINPSRGPNP